MNDFRLIAIDLDGTLLCPQGQVRPRVKNAIQHCLADKFLICFATGRNWTESRRVLQEADHHDLAVFVGGAMVIDTRSGVTLQRTIMQPQLACEICQALEDAGHAVLALQDTSVAGVDYLVTAGSSMNQVTLRWFKATTTAVRPTGNLGRHTHEHTIRVGICASREQIAPVKKLLSAQFGPRIHCQSLYVPGTDVEVVEVFDPAVNKWHGVLHVADRYGVSPEQIIAIGDDVNDLSMIRSAGLGVAMGNAHPEVIAAAHRTIGSNDQEGLACFLEELIDYRNTKSLKPPGREAAA